MTSHSADDARSAREQAVDTAIAEYLQAAQSGAPLDREAWLAAHAEIADELREFVADQDRFARVVAPFKPPAAGSSADEATVGLAVNATPEMSGNRLRYFGEYELLDELGRGGMGVVYKARQVPLKRIVAIKMILAGQLAGEADIGRFHAEAEAAAKLDHPGIVPIFEVGEHEGYHYFSMAFVDGESLSRRVARQLFEPREAAALLQKIATAVAYAHAEGVVHRDLKPANVLVDRAGQPRITDFGLAKRVEAQGSGLTVTGQILGTPGYMPPEQARGETQAVGPPADVYSLGAMLYCLLTGRPPFQTANAVDTLIQVLTCEPLSPRHMNEAVPRDLETIVLKCLDKEPTRRYESARALADELQRFLDGRPILARPLGVAARAWRWCRRSPAIAALAGAVAAALLIGSIVSSAFAVLARREAERALMQEELARASAASAANQAELAQRQAVEAQQARDRAEFHLLQRDRDLYAADLRQVQQAWNDGRLDRVRSLLARHDRTAAGGFDHRGFEWFYWRRRVDETRDGAQAIATNDGAEVKAWAPGEAMETVPNDFPPLSFGTEATNPDGATRAAATGNVVRIRDASSGADRVALEGHPADVTAAVFAPDGRRIVSGDASGELKLWDVASGQELLRLQLSDAPLVAVGFSRDGLRLVAVGNKSRKIWSAEPAAR